MSDSYASDIPIDSNWVDLTVAYPAAANVQSWVQNKAAGNVLVAYSSSASAPAGGGVVLQPLDQWIGNAAHIWVKALGSSASISIGLL